MTTTGLSPRDRIVRAAADLLSAGGRDAVSTRAVSSAAGVQVPTIYRHFGDMRGLLDAAASFGFAAYLRRKTSRARAADPVDDLRRGWDLHVEFGLTNPAIYALMYGDPVPGAEPTAARAAAEVLRGLVQRIAEAGRLRVGVERAAQVVHAAGRGVTLSLIGTQSADRDPTLSETTREAILAAVTTDGADTGSADAAPPDRVAADRTLVRRAVALKAVLPAAPAGFTAAEASLFAEWLDRIAAAP